MLKSQPFTGIDRSVHQMPGWAEAFWRHELVIPSGAIASLAFIAVAVSEGPAVAVDWTIPVGSLIGFCGTLLLVGIAMLRLSWSVQSTLNTRFTELNNSVTKGLTDLRLDLTAFKGEAAEDVAEAKTDATKAHSDLKEETLRALSRVESNVRDLATRVNSIETGQSEWIKTLRDRTHDLSGQVDALNLKAELLANGVLPKKPGHEQA